MAELDFSIGIGFILGIVFSLGVDILKEILVKKYIYRKEKKETKTQIKEDLKANITTLFTMWENHKISYIIYEDFKEDLKIQLKEIVTFYTTSAKDLEEALIIKIRKNSSEFLELVNTSEPNWFEIIKTEGDKLCNEYREIVQDL